MMGERRWEVFPSGSVGRAILPRRKSWEVDDRRKVWGVMLMKA
jgi:hypothetical protein